MGKYKRFLKKTLKKGKAAAAKKYEEYKIERKKEREIERKIRTKAKQAGYQEKEKQAMRYAREKEKYKTDTRLKTMRSGTTSFGTITTALTGPTTKKKPQVKRKTKTAENKI